ncbi:efflux RND transporter permease subunit, partial [Campylobacter coli]|uniref:efflux RND transporter permease subunit n=1 Tax=Campylobacter coli TaxID=195 RepID=UPI003F7C35F1
IDDPKVSKIDVEGQAIQTYAVSSANMTLEELSWFVDDTVKRSLQGAKGVGRIDRFGGADREIRIQLDPLKMKSFGVSASDINTQLRLTNT